MALAAQTRQVRGFVLNLSRRAHTTADLHQNETQKHHTDVAIVQKAKEKQRRIQLHELVRFKNMSPVPEKLLLENAEHAISDITVRLAQRLVALRNLPFIVVLNPHVSRIYNIYHTSFRVMNSLTPPKTLDENEQFVEVLNHLVRAHTDTIPTLAKGFSEARRYLRFETIDAILREHLTARIGTRLLAEHHIALTHPLGSNYVGSIQNDLCPADIVHTCSQVVGQICSLQYGIVPDVEVDQGQRVKLAYVPVHLEYILTELLKNAGRAVCESNNTNFPILVTVIPTGQGVIIRLRDRGGGIAPQRLEDIFKFSYTTFGLHPTDNDRGGGNMMFANAIAGLGYGLPLSRAYAEFFGGSLQVQSYFGWGTDVYLTLKSPAVHGYRREI